jgi:hypothetical protein
MSNRAAVVALLDDARSHVRGRVQGRHVTAARALVAAGQGPVSPDELNAVVRRFPGARLPLTRASEQASIAPWRGAVGGVEEDVRIAENNVRLASERLAAAISERPVNPERQLAAQQRLVDAQRALQAAQANATNPTLMQQAADGAEYAASLPGRAYQAVTTAPTRAYDAAVDARQAMIDEAANKKGEWEKWLDDLYNAVATPIGIVAVVATTGLLIAVSSSTPRRKK